MILDSTAVGVRSATGRRGGVLLPGVMMLLAIVTVAAITRSYFTTSLATECQTALQGELCLELASSIVAELESKIRSRLADPSSEASRLLAAPVMGESQPVDLTDQIVIEEATRMAAAEPYQGYVIGTYSVKVAIQKCLDGLPYERVGVLTLTASAYAPGHFRPVSRTIEEARTLKVVLAGPPRPFGRYGLMVANMSGITDLDRVGPLKERLAGLLGRYRSRLEQAAGSLTGDPKERVLDLLDAIPTVESVRSRVPDVGTGRTGILYGMMVNGAELDLSNLDLARRMQVAADKADAALAGLASTAGDFVERARAAGDVIDEALWAVWAFKEAFTVLDPTAVAATATPSAPPGGDSDDHHHSSDPGALAAAHRELVPFFGKLRAGYLHRRAFWKLSESEFPDGDVSARLAKLARKGPLHGVVQIDNPSRPLKLSGSVPGKLMIVVGAGGIALESVNANPGPEDRLTVACLGGTMTVRGNCSGHLVVGDKSTLVMDPSVRFTGGITMMELTAGSRLEGILVRDEGPGMGSMGSGGEEMEPGLTFAVGLSPRILYRKVLRS